MRSELVRLPPLSHGRPGYSFFLFLLLGGGEKKQQQLKDKAFLYV